MNSEVSGLPMDAEFQIHAAALYARDLDRDELEEAFIDLFHQKMIDLQMFLNILKDHGIDADINLKFLTESQIS